MPLKIQIKIQIKILLQSIVILLFFYLGEALADGTFIDKIYHPYVQENEKEIEWRALLENDSSKEKKQTYKFAYGQSVSSNIFTEIYIIGEKQSGSNIEVSAFELELLWQITEQGEYDYDWGLLVELEHELDTNISEVSTALLIEKEWQYWVATGNLYLIYEWGDTIQNEFETALSVQAKYRYSRILEPAIEFYSNEITSAIGPVFLGDIKLSGKQKIHWEAGVLFALDEQTTDETIRLLFEFEF